MMPKFGFLLILSLLGWVKVDALSVCAPVDSLFILSSELIQQSQDSIGPFFHDLIYLASSELSGLGVLTFGDVAGGFENPLLDLTETIGANTAHSMETIATKLSVAEALDDTMTGFISLEEAMVSAHQLFEAENAGHEMEAVFVMDLESDDGNSDRVAMCFDATTQIVSNKDSDTLSFIEGLYYVTVDDQLDVKEIFDCFTMTEVYYEDKDILSTLYDLTCPSQYKVDGDRTFTLSGTVQLIELGSILSCDMIPDESLCKAASFALDPSSSITVIDDSNDNMSYEEGYILMATAAIFQLLPKECFVPMMQIESIEVLDETTESHEDGEQYKKRILKLNVIYPEDIFSYLTAAHMGSVDGQKEAIYQKRDYDVIDPDAVQEARSILIARRRRRRLSGAESRRRRLICLPWDTDCIAEQNGRMMNDYMNGDDVDFASAIVDCGTECNNIVHPMINAQINENIMPVVSSVNDAVQEVGDQIEAGLRAVGSAFEDVIEWLGEMFGCLDLDKFSVDIETPFTLECEGLSCTITHTFEESQYFWIPEGEGDRRRLKKASNQKKKKDSDDGPVSAETELKAKIRTQFSFAVVLYGPKFDSTGVKELGAELQGSMSFTFEIEASASGKISYEWDGIKKHLTRKPFVTTIANSIPIVWWPQMGIGFEGSVESIFEVKASYSYTWSAQFGVGAKIENGEMIPIASFSHSEQKTDEPLSPERLLEELKKIDVEPPCPTVMPFSFAFPITLGIEFYLAVYPHVTFTPALEGNITLLYDGCSADNCESGWKYPNPNFGALIPMGVQVESELKLGAGMGMAAGYLGDVMSCILDLPDLGIEIDLSDGGFTIGFPTISSCEADDESAITLVNMIDDEYNGVWYEHSKTYNDEPYYTKWAYGCTTYLYRTTDEYDDGWTLADDEGPWAWCDTPVLEDCTVGEWWNYDGYSWRVDEDAYLVKSKSATIPASVTSVILVKQYFPEFDGVWHKDGSNTWNDKPVYTKCVESWSETCYLRYYAVTPDQGPVVDGWEIGCNTGLRDLTDGDYWAWCYETDLANCGQWKWSHYDKRRGSWATDGDAYLVIGDQVDEDYNGVWPGITLANMHWYELNGVWHEDGTLYSGQKRYNIYAYNQFYYLYRWWSDDGVYDGWSIDDQSAYMTAWCDVPDLKDCTAGEWWFKNDDGVWAEDSDATVDPAEFPAELRTVILVDQYRSEFNGEWVEYAGTVYPWEGNDDGYPSYPVYTKWALDRNCYLHYEPTWNGWNIGMDPNGDGFEASIATDFWYYSWCDQPYIEGEDHNAEDCVAGTWFFWDEGTQNWEYDGNAYVLTATVNAAAKSVDHSMSGLQPKPDFHPNSGDATSTHSDSDGEGSVVWSFPMIIGAVIGVAVIAVFTAIVVISVKRKKPAAKEAGIDKVIHVSDGSVDAVIEETEDKESVTGTVVDGVAAMETAVVDEE